MPQKEPLAQEAVLSRPRPVALLGLTAGFVALAVGTPYAVHMLGGAPMGRVFLPMHFFVLCSGLLLGWQPGLAAGILSPAISFGLSGMPPLALLLPLTLEMSVYGLVAGLLSRSLKRNAFLSLAVAIVCGRIAVGLAVLVLGIEGPLQYLGSALRAGIPGMAIQFALLPFIVRLFGRRAAQ